MPGHVALMTENVTVTTSHIENSLAFLCYRFLQSQYVQKIVDVPLSFDAYVCCAATGIGPNRRNPGALSKDFPVKVNLLAPTLVGLGGRICESLI
jgi:hypothetical protein